MTLLKQEVTRRFLSHHLQIIVVVVVGRPDHRPRVPGIYTSNDHATKRVKVNNRITQPISDKIWYSERMVYHEMVVAKVLQFGVFCTGGVRGIPH